MELGLVDRVYRETGFLLSRTHFLLVKMVLAWSGLLHGGGKNKLPPNWKVLS